MPAAFRHKQHAHWFLVYGMCTYVLYIRVLEQLAYALFARLPPQRDENGRLRSRKARRLASELGSDASEDARAMPFTPPSKQEAQAYAALSTKRRWV